MFSSFTVNKEENLGPLNLAKVSGSCGSETAALVPDLLFWPRRNGVLPGDRPTVLGSAQNLGVRLRLWGMRQLTAIIRTFRAIPLL